MTHRLEAWPTNKRPYPAKNKSVQVWIYFGFRKIKEGPANKENFEIAKYELSFLLNYTTWWVMPFSTIFQLYNASWRSVLLMKEQVWIYFGFRKIKEGPANKENFEIAKAICKIYGKEYKKSFKY
jgi:hypothetical protein